MNREQAKIYASLTREQVSKLNYEYGKLYDIICAYANGATIEMKRPGLDGWYERINPLFDAWSEYRVKEAASEKQTHSKQETVESLDGHELSDAEKGVIRILRRCEFEADFGDFAFANDLREIIVCNCGTLFDFREGGVAKEFCKLANDVSIEAKKRIEKGEPTW